MTAPSLRHEYGLSLAQTGLLISSSLVGSVLSLIPWGLATDRVGERTVLVIGLAACGACLLGAAAQTGFWPLAALLAAAGLTGASVQSASGRAVMHWFGAEQRGLALGLRQTAIPLSGFVVSLVLPPVVAAGGVRWGFASMGLACLAGAAVGGLVLREGPAAAVAARP
ncbi:MAG: MFS transporter, partial [Gaiellaceae bacterium]